MSQWVVSSSEIQNRESGTLVVTSRQQMCFLLQEVGPQGIVIMAIFFAVVIGLLIAIVIAIAYRLKKRIRTKSPELTNQNKN